VYIVQSELLRPEKKCDNNLCTIRVWINFQVAVDLKRNDKCLVNSKPIVSC